MADVGEEKTFGDGDVCGVLVGGVRGTLIGVPLAAHMGIAAVGTMLRRRRSCKKKQPRLKLLVRDAEGAIS